MSIPTCTYSKAGVWWCFAVVLGVRGGGDQFVVTANKSLVLVFFVIFIFIVCHFYLSYFCSLFLALCSEGIDPLLCLVASRLIAFQACVYVVVGEG